MADQIRRQRFVSPKFLAAGAMGATKHGEPRLFKCWEMLEGQRVYT